MRNHIIAISIAASMLNTTVNLDKCDTTSRNDRRGTKLDIDAPKAKKKSEKLKRLLRK